ncbi:MAG: YceD family protein [Ilumatobacteraceae bacterium]
MPDSPVCRPDCAGLCPACGADRNGGDCGCRIETPDPRWAGLDAIRDQLPE